MSINFKKFLTLTCTIVAACLFLSNTYANSWPVYAPTGIYLVGEAGLGWITNNKLKDLTPVSQGSVTFAEPKQEMSDSLAEHVAIGDYMMNPDSITAVGLELGFTHFNRLKSTVSTSIDGVKTTGSQDTTAWSTTLEGIASFNIVGNSMALFGKLGLGYANIKRSVIIVGAPAINVDKTNDSGVGIAGGIGLRFALTKNIALRVEGDGFTGGGHTNYVAGLAGVELNF